MTYKITDKVLKQIESERAYQIDKWGKVDNQNTPYNFAAYIGAYTNRNLVGVPGDTEARRKAFKEDMIKVAALAVAAIDNL